MLLGSHTATIERLSANVTARQSWDVLQRHRLAAHQQTLGSRDTASMLAVSHSLFNVSAQAARVRKPLLQLVASHGSHNYLVGLEIALFRAMHTAKAGRSFEHATSLATTSCSLATPQAARRCPPFCAGATRPRRLCTRVSRVQRPDDSRYDGCLGLNVR